MGFEIKTKNVHFKFGSVPIVKDEEVKLEPKNTTVKIPKKDFTYAPLRTSILPTPAQLREAVMAVDRDPRPLMDILRRLPEADPHIFSVGNTRQLAILGYDWKVEPSVENNDVEKAKCEDIENSLERTNFHQLFTSLTNGIVYGHSVTNPIWHLDAKNRYYPKFDFLEGIHFGKKDGKVKMIVDKNDKDFFATIGNNANLTGINNQYQIATALSGSGNIVWMDLNEDDLIIVNCVPPILQGWKNNYVGGLMRPGLYLTLLKYFTLLDWAKFNELFGMPVRVGKFDPVLTSDAGIEILKTAVTNLGTDAAAVIDKTTEMQFLEAMGKGTNSTFESFAEHVERKQSMVFVGQNLTTEQTGKFGSNAMAQTQNLVRMDYMWADLQMVESHVQKIIEKMYFFNYGNPPEGFYPKFKFFTEETKDLQQLSGVVDDLTRAGLPISKKWAYETFDISGPEDEQDSFGTNNPSPFNTGD